VVVGVVTFTVRVLMVVVAVVMKIDHRRSEIGVMRLDRQMPPGAQPRDEAEDGDADPPPLPQTFTGSLHERRA
jgi:hypothetical protein